MWDRGYLYSYSWESNGCIEIQCFKLFLVNHEMGILVYVDINIHVRFDIFKASPHFQTSKAGIGFLSKVSCITLDREEKMELPP